MKTGRNKHGVYYWTDYIDGKRVIRKNKSWKSQKEAKAHHNLFIKKIEAESNRSNDITVENAIDLFINNYSLSRKESSSLRMKQTLYKHVMPHFGSIYIENVSPILIQKWQKKLLDTTYGKHDIKYSNAYIELIQTSFKNLLEFCRKFEYINKNPFDMVHFVKRRNAIKTKEIRILTYDQYSTFISYVDDIVYKALFDVLYWCGLRIGELLALKIKYYDQHHKILLIKDNFDTKNGVITTTKNDRERFVSVPDLCAESIETLLKAYEKSYHTKLDINAPLFAYDGIIPKGTLDRYKENIWKSVNEKINEYNIKNPEAKKPTIPRFTWHELRHTHVSTLIDVKMEPFDIAKRLGHSVDMVNDTYGHLFPQRQDKLLDALNSIPKKNTKDNESKIEENTE